MNALYGNSAMPAGPNVPRRVPLAQAPGAWSAAGVTDSLAAATASVTDTIVAATEAATGAVAASVNAVSAAAAVSPVVVDSIATSAHI
ncbi:hypothetical protein [Robbsia sp. KACC 23696]|uniref:hypothetical protein n=1 Tax=Robbsia sp. KACC 23696 TaxID=3149231 RepID=UPI00325B67C1